VTHFRHFYKLSTSQRKPSTRTHRRVYYGCARYKYLLTIRTWLCKFYTKQFRVDLILVNSDRVQSISHISTILQIWLTINMNQMLQYRLTKAITFSIHSVKTLKESNAHMMQTNFKRLCRQNIAYHPGYFTSSTQSINSPSSTTPCTTLLCDLPILTSCYFLTCNFMSNLSSSLQQISIIDCKSHNEADSSRSSA